MAYLPLRSVTLPADVSGRYDAWLEQLQDRLAAARAPTGTGSPATCCSRSGIPALGDYDELVADPATPESTRLALLSLDPRNVTLEPEYYADVDPERFARVKPLLWLWYSFDRSPLGRAERAPRRAVPPGAGARISSPAAAATSSASSSSSSPTGTTWRWATTCVVHRHVLLDDRGGITLGNRVSISDYANIYSHTHSIVEQKDVTNARTVLEDDVRITYHATVLAGVRVGRNGDGRARAPWPPRTCAPTT